MAKTQWQPTEGMIVNVENALGRHEQKYTIEVRKWDGPLIQRVVKHKAFPPYDVGTRVKCQISDDNEVRFDPDHPGEMAIISSMTMSDQIAEAAAAFGRGPVGPSFPESPSRPAFGSMSKVRGAEDVSFVITTSSGTPVTLAGSGIAAVVMALSTSPGASMRMEGPGGLGIDVDPAEIKKLAHTMRSSDPAERKAAIERWHHLREQAMGREPREAGVTSGGQGAGSVADRLRKLDTLLSQGIVTQSEYDAQRQRILSEL